MPALFLSGKATFKVKPVNEEQDTAIADGIDSGFYGLSVSFDAAGVPTASVMWKNFVKKGDFVVTKEDGHYLVEFDGVFKNTFGQSAFDAVLQNSPEIRITSLDCGEQIAIDGVVGKEMPADFKFTKTAPKKW